MCFIGKTPKKDHKRNHVQDAYISEVESILIK